MTASASPYVSSFRREVAQCAILRSALGPMRNRSHERNCAKTSPMPSVHQTCPSRRSKTRCGKMTEIWALEL
jgi:hypothetical protein